MTVHGSTVNAYNIVIIYVLYINRVNIISLFLNILLNINSDYLVHFYACFIPLVNEHFLVNNTAVGHNSLTGNSPAVSVNVRIIFAVSVFRYLHTEHSSPYRKYGIRGVYYVILVLCQRGCYLIGHSPRLQADNGISPLIGAQLHKRRTAVLLKLDILVAVKEHTGIAVVRCGEYIAVP